MQKLFLVSFIVSALGGLSGCAVRDAIKETKEQINYLEDSNKEITTKIDSISKEEKDFLVSMQAMTFTKFSDLENKIAVVENKIEDMQQLYRKTPGKQAGFGADSGKSIRRNFFAIAYSDFTKGNYELAIAGFQKYLSDLPRSAEAYYLLGESYYAMEKHADALIVFKNLIQNYPVYEKLPTVLYKLCLIYETQHDTLALQDCLKKLFEDYPETTEAKLAKERFTKPIKPQEEPPDSVKGTRDKPEEEAPEPEKKTTETKEDTLKTEEKAPALEKETSEPVENEITE